MLFAAKARRSHQNRILSEHTATFLVVGAKFINTSFIVDHMKYIMAWRRQIGTLSIDAEVVVHVPRSHRYIYFFFLVEMIEDEFSSLLLYSISEHYLLQQTCASEQSHTVFYFKTLQHRNIRHS